MLKNQNKEWRSRKLGEYLKKLRREKRIKQKEISDALGYNSLQFISNLERGLSNPSPLVVGQILEIIGTSNKAIEEIMSIETRYVRAELLGKKL